MFSFGVPFFGSQAGIVSQPVTGMAACPVGVAATTWPGTEGAVYGYGPVRSRLHRPDRHAQPAGRRHRGRPGRERLLAGGGRRRRASPSGRTRRSSARPAPSRSTSRSSASPRHRATTATTWWRPTAASSPTGRGPASTARWAVSTSTSPSSAMAMDPSTGGYWLVAADGGVFSFDAPFLGSMGGDAAQQADRGHRRRSDRGRVLPGGLGRRHLRLRSGAKFQGSTGGLPLNAPVMGMALG